MTLLECCCYKVKSQAAYVALSKLLNWNLCSLHFAQLIQLSFNWLIYALLCFDDQTWWPFACLAVIFCLVLGQALQVPPNRNWSLYAFSESFFKMAFCGQSFHISCLFRNQLWSNSYLSDIDGGTSTFLFFQQEGFLMPSPRIVSSTAKFFVKMYVQFLAFINFCMCLSSCFVHMCLFVLFEYTFEGRIDLPWFNLLK